MYLFFHFGTHVCAKEFDESIVAGKQNIPYNMYLESSNLLRFEGTYKSCCEKLL